MRKNFDENGEIEDIEGFYDRVQKLKQMLSDELTPEVALKIGESPHNKILLVAHKGILSTISCSGIDREKAKHVKAFNLSVLTDARTYLNCEILPFEASNTTTEEILEWR